MRKNHVSREMIAEISKRIRTARNDLGFTIRDLAKYCGLSVSYICEIENERNKNPSLGTLLLISKGLGADPSFICAFDLVRSDLDIVDI